jgi:hypothetical protein
VNLCKERDGVDAAAAVRALRCRRCERDRVQVLRDGLAQRPREPLPFPENGFPGYCPTEPGALSSESCTRESCRWDDRPDARPFAQARYDREFPGCARNALSHRLQPQMTWERSPAIEPPAVVTDLQQELVTVLLQPHVDRGRRSMLDRVAHCLLPDPVQHFFHVKRHRRLSRALHSNLHFVARANGRNLLFDRGHKALTFECFGAELAQYGLHFNQR